jgi:hypothetical protein
MPVFRKIFGFSLACLATLPFFGCKDANSVGSPSAYFLVRVVSTQADTIAVVIGPADFGSIPPGDTTIYRNVYEGNNVVLLNGEVSPHSPANFGHGSYAVCRWTYVFADGGAGFFLDNCD